MKNYDLIQARNGTIAQFEGQDGQPKEVVGDHGPYYQLVDVNGNPLFSENNPAHVQLTGSRVVLNDEEPVFNAVYLEPSEATSFGHIVGLEEASKIIIYILADITVDLEVRFTHFIFLPREATDRHMSSSINNVQVLSSGSHFGAFYVVQNKVSNEIELRRSDSLYGGDDFEFFRARGIRGLQIENVSDSPVTITSYVVGVI